MKNRRLNYEESYPMTIIERLQEQRKAAKAELDALIATAEARSDDDAGITDEELEQVRAFRTTIEEKDGRIAELVETNERTAAANAVEHRANPAGVGTVVKVGAEPQIYHQAGEHSFFVDAYRAHKHQDPSAVERINRSNAMERAGLEARAVTVSALGALVPQQYLIDMYAPLARAGRPFANAIQGLPLPPTGTVFNIPKITTGTTTAIQATENASVSNTDIADTDVVVPVRTIAGQQDISRQSLERGTPGIDQLIFMDLVAAYAANVDNQALNGAGTSGTLKGVFAATGIISVAYTDGTPTVGELYPKLADAIQRVNTQRFLPATAIFMHPRRWGWFTAAVDANNRPLVVPNQSAAFNAIGTGVPAATQQVVGQILGLPVITDPNIPTTWSAGAPGAGTEDAIIVARASDILLWENGDGSPRELRFEETLGNQLTVKLVVYGYAAFTAERYPVSVAVIGGTGMVAPTF